MFDLTRLLAPVTRNCVVAVIAVLTVGAATMCAWSQAMQQQPAPQKSITIQVVPAPSAAPPPAAAFAPAPMAEQAPPPSPPPAPENPGLFNEIGKLFKNSTSLLPSLPTMPSLGTDSLTKLNTVVKGRVACPVAANGAPDCKAASDKLCQSKGFKDGKSLDTDAAQSCSPRAMIPGRAPEPGDCKTENYVTQALCQ
ncbi:hypothetical protein AB8B21_29765 [Tardiphaga sp. 866_E4_N2_1]|uniref:hypothetical protein n=1 Tax=unclassified Tardiphaga TaxID=2631404 RepID=UPI003F26750E